MSMKFFARLLPLLAACCLVMPLVVRAGSDDKNQPAAVTESTEQSPGFKLSGEFEASDAYVGSADVRRDGRSYSLDEHNSNAQIMFNPRTPIGYLRLGAAWERYSFGFSDNASLPNTLQNVNLIVGLDTKLSDSILVRIEAQPGIYGTFFNGLHSGDFNVPFVFGATYIYSPNLQIVLGVGVDINRNVPVFPGLGVRWKIAPKLVLNAIAPTPRIEYELTKSTTLYAGAELKAGNFRVDRHFGDSHSDARLNRAVVTFSEVRVGVGLTQKLGSAFTLTAEGGCQPYREFDFHRVDARYRNDGLAPYGQFALHADF